MTRAESGALVIITIILADIVLAMGSGGATPATIGMKRRRPRHGRRGGWEQCSSARQCPIHQRIERARRACGGRLEHVRVDHRGAHVGVAEQLLHGADVGAGLQQVRRERMTQRVHRGRFRKLLELC